MILRSCALTILELPSRFPRVLRGLLVLVESLCQDIVSFLEGDASIPESISTLQLSSSTSRLHLRIFSLDVR